MATIIGLCGSFSSSTHKNRRKSTCCPTCRMECIINLEVQPDAQHLDPFAANAFSGDHNFANGSSHFAIARKDAVGHRGALLGREVAGSPRHQLLNFRGESQAAQRLLRPNLCRALKTNDCFDLMRHWIKLKSSLNNS